MSLLVVVGMKSEAALLDEGTRVVIGAGNASELAWQIEREICIRHTDAILSFGVAGGLSPVKLSGSLIVGNVVIDGKDRITCDPYWSSSMYANCGSMLPHLWRSNVVGSDTLVTTVDDKCTLFCATYASVVDMESAIAARAAKRHGLPFGLLRAVVDPWDMMLPVAALHAIDCTGGIDVWSVVKSLVCEPRQLPNLLRLARCSRAAMSSLELACTLLGPTFGAPCSI